jgi:hypothetical protein
LVQSRHRAASAAVRWLAVALLAAAIAGCAQLQEIFTPSAPGVSAEWRALLDEIRLFEKRIGFEETDNFIDLEKDEESYPICGVAPQLALPYSYEDPTIQWRDIKTEKECRAAADGSDVYFATVEAWGEIGTPVTPSMVDAKLDRFLYLVIHEDCHDQFELPYGIEEALCNLITYKAMEIFTRQKFGSIAREHRAIRRYADEQSRLTRATKAAYEQLAALYARYDRGELTAAAMLRERAAFFAKVERKLALKRGELNNVILANDMTYSRHYPLLEKVHETLGNDIVRTIAFFREVDEHKPSTFSVRRRHRLLTETSVEFIRAYEAAVVETIENELAKLPRR